MSFRTSDPTCQRCGKPLRDIASRYRLVGPDCWSRMTATEQAQALEYAKTTRDPFAIPADRAPSLQARLNNINARRTIQHPGEGQLCHHEQIVGRCPDCRREQDPWRATERIMAAVLAESLEGRRAERIALQTARKTAGIPAPARRPTPRPARRRTTTTTLQPEPPAGPTQLELL